MRFARGTKIPTTTESDAKQAGYIDHIAGESEYDSVVETKQPCVKLRMKYVIVGVSNEINPLLSSLRAMRLKRYGREN